MVEFELLKHEIKKFVEEREWGQFHNSKSLVLALASECGELADIVRWIPESESDNLNSEMFTAMESELADVFIFLVLLSCRQDIDLMKAVQKKLKENGVRYPVTQAKGNSVKYNKLK